MALSNDLLINCSLCKKIIPCVLYASEYEEFSLIASLQ